LKRSEREPPWTTPAPVARDRCIPMDHAAHGASILAGVLVAANVRDLDRTEMDLVAFVATADDGERHPEHHVFSSARRAAA
jgi:hypothetical protein